MAIVALADAKRRLKIDSLDTTYDAELTPWLAAIGPALELYKHEVIEQRTVTDQIELCQACKFRIWSTPVISLTSVESWDGATTWDVANLAVTSGGVVRVMSGSPVDGLVDVVYEAGYATIPANYSEAALVALQNMWRGEERGVMGVQSRW